MKPNNTNRQFTDLYEAHYDEVLAYCIRRIGSSEADEVAAEVFVVAWRRLEEIDLETARAWLFGVARGVLANRWRSGQRRTRLVGRLAGLAAPAPLLPEDNVVRRAEDEEVIKALRKLKAADREVLMLASWEELSAREIAHAVGISVAAAEQRLHRARRRLAKVLASPVALATRSPRAAEERGGGL
jgi:RNA polymerase sigma-70 factor (ECF subfamily)